MLTNRDRTAVLDYDLNMFDVDEKENEKRAKRNRDIADRVKNPNTSLSKKGSWFFSIVLAACVLSVLFIYFHGKIELDEIRFETNAASARLEKAAQENNRLRTNLEAMATPAKIEAYAAENGLIKEQLSQATHITLNIESITEVAETDENDIFWAIKSEFDDVLEFLGLR